MTTEAEFHARRRVTVGASDVAKILGISPFGAALDVYRYKLGLGDSGAISTEKTERGNRQEEFVLREFASWAQCEVRNQQLAVVHPVDTWASATLDGMGYRGLTSIGPVEAKTISAKLYLEPPKYYLIQVLWQCWVTDSPSGHLAVFSTKEQKFQAYPIAVVGHMDFLNEAINRCRDFWYGNVVAGVPPEPPKRRERSEGDLPTHLCERYLEIGEEIKALTAARSQIQSEIIDYLGYPEDLHIEDGCHKLDLAKGRLNIRRTGLRP